MRMTVQSEITAALEAAFQPRELSVENESFRHSVPPDSETHFKVVLVTEQFSGERSVKRHQRVYGVLAEWLAMQDQLSTRTRIVSWLVRETREPQVSQPARDYTCSCYGRSYIYSRCQ